MTQNIKHQTQALLPRMERRQQGMSSPCLWIHSPVSTDVLLEDGLVGAAPSGSLVFWLLGGSGQWAALKAVRRMDSGLVGLHKKGTPASQMARYQNTERKKTSPISCQCCPLARLSQKPEHKGAAGCSSYKSIFQWHIAGDGRVDPERQAEATSMLSSSHPGRQGPCLMSYAQQIFNQYPLIDLTLRACTCQPLL